MAAGRAFAGENINRRVNLEDGTHVYLPRQKGLYQYATGITDEEIGVVAFREVVTGFPIATLVNYAAHALTIGNWKWVVSADYPGVFAGNLSRLTGGAVHLYPGRVRKRPPLRLRNRPPAHGRDGDAPRGEGLRRLHAPRVRGR